MRHVLMLFLVAVAVDAATAPGPVQLARRTGALSPSYYQQQADLWMDHVQTQPQDTQAWHSLYLSSEYGRQASDEQLDTILERMSAAVPDSWQLPYLQARRVGLKDLPRHLQLLRQASDRCGQQCADIDESLGLVHELRTDTTAATDAWRRFYASHALASGLLDYNYNLLQTVDTGSVLITNGDNDTMPAWLLQRVHGVRQDVIIINLAVAHSQRAWLADRLRQWQIDVDASALAEEPARFLDQLVQLLAPRGPVYVALTVPARQRTHIEASLRLCGLAARFDATGTFDATTAMRINFSQRYRLDGLRHDWYGELHDSWRPIVRRLNTNYGYGLLALAASHDDDGRWSGLARHLARVSDDAHFAQLIRQRLEEID